MTTFCETIKFAYENLDVWNKAVDFAVEVIDTVDDISTGRRHYRLLEQIFELKKMR